MTVAIIVGLILTIMLHEFGHYIMAKRSGMKVTEFFLGFGPRIWSFRTRRDRVRRQGDPRRRLRPHHRDERTSRRSTPRTSRAPTGRRRTGKRLITVLAGIIVNLIIALMLVFGILVLHGPEKASTKIDLVSKGSPAAAAGLKSGDKIVAINGTRDQGLGPGRHRHQAEPGQAADLHRRARRSGRHGHRDAEDRSTATPRVGITSALVGDR